MRIQSKVLKVLINLLVTVIVGGIYFYVSLPALNFQSQSLYVFVILLCAVYMVTSLITSGFEARGGLSEYFSFVKSQCKIPAFIIIAFLLVGLIGSLISWKVIRANSYKNLIQVEPGNFATDVSEISFDQIPMLDKDSAERLGDRKLGELSDMVSQFEVASDYSQINLNGRPVRVTPLEYGDIIKWFNNRKQGLPAFLVTDMANQSVDVVRMDNGIQYSNSDHFGRNLMRHIRFNYPTFMFSAPTFEVDDEYNPYWICPRIVKRVGLFGGTDVKGAVLVNAVTGESSYYEEVPQWVDRVYPADLIVEQYDYYGAFRNGFINSFFGQKDVTKTTAGYNYIALNDDVYMYTGVTSAGMDQSNVGFLLSNQRTKETKYYPVAGATEYSAMSSAEGVVQHLNYKATFPLLLNVSSQPTYFISLKDNAQLVKMYAMVNVAQYQIVATGASVADCEREYIRLLSQNNITTGESSAQNKVSGTIAEIRSAVKEGNSFYYIRLENDPVFYTVSAAAAESAVILNPGDKISIEYAAEDTGEIKKIYSITRDAAKPLATATPEPTEQPLSSMQPATPAPELTPAPTQAPTIVPAA